MGAGAVMRRAKGRKALCCRVAHVPIATCGVCESCEKRLMHPPTAVMLRDMKTRRIDSARAARRQAHPFSGTPCADCRVPLGPK